MEPELERQVDALRKAGRYEEAAMLCLQAGDARRASELYAAVWDWPKAIKAAEDGGLFALAYEHALAGQARDAIFRLLTLLPDHPEQALEAAAAAERKGRVVDAARLREAAGETDEAAALFERAGELFEAARCREAAGQYREAGILYERRVREDPTDGEAALRLGRILAHFGRFDHAARALQKAEEDPDRRVAALELLVACFDALKMGDAASGCLDRLRREDPSLPIRVPDFLQQTFGSPRGIAGLSKGEESSQLLAARYRILRPLGEGGTGRVLLAHDGFYDREVAVKVLTVGRGAQGRDAYARFAREARVAAGLDHPNVVSVYEFNPDGPFLVMEYMPGGTLDDRLASALAEGRRLPLAVVRHVCDAILRGLEAVHRRGVIHRDLKPANVFFGATGDVKIGDFGVAHLQDLGSTLTGAMMGTLAYMAPEQITGSAKPKAPTDLYAFGCILHQLLTGEPPYPGPDFVTQHLQDPPPAPSKRRYSLDPAFDALMLQLLAKGITERPQSVDEVRRILDALDWTDPDANVLEQLIEDEARPKALGAPAAPPEPERVSAPPSVPPAGDRFSLEEPLDDGTMRGTDGMLGRRVRLRRMGPDEQAFFVSLARCDDPFLQAVFDVDPELERVVLEDPAGDPLPRALLDEATRRQVRAQIGQALKSMHAKGVVHGDVRGAHIVVGAGRAVLMLPLEPRAGDAAADFAALAALF